MNSILVEELISVVGWTLIHSSWQWGLIGVGYFLCSTILRQKSPNHRYIGGMLALGIGLSLHIGTGIFLYQPIPSTTEATVVLQNYGQSQVEVNPIPINQVETVIPWKDQLEIIFPWLLGGWVLGVLLMSIRMGGGYVYLETLKRKGLSPLSDDWNSQLTHLVRRFGLGQNIQIYCSQLVNEPLTLGHFKPFILIPVGMLTSLTPDQVEAILAHELAHIKRFDFLLNMIQSVIEILFFFHPVVWWISKEIRREREACCDDLAVQICGDAHVYASALTQAQMLRSTFQPIINHERFW